MTDHTTTQATGPLVEVTGLRKAFGGTTVLRDIDFTVPKGSVTVLLGPSGSGKTTVLRSLNVLDLPDAEYRVDAMTELGELDDRLSKSEDSKHVVTVRAEAAKVTLN